MRPRRRADGQHVLPGSVPDVVGASLGGGRGRGSRHVPVLRPVDRRPGQSGVRSLGAPDAVGAECPDRHGDPLRPAQRHLRPQRRAGPDPAGGDRGGDRPRHCIADRPRRCSGVPPGLPGHRLPGLQQDRPAPARHHGRAEPVRPDPALPRRDRHRPARHRAGRAAPRRGQLRHDRHVASGHRRGCRRPSAGPAHHAGHPRRPAVRSPSPASRRRRPRADHARAYRPRARKISRAWSTDSRVGGGVPSSGYDRPRAAYLSTPRRW